MAIRFFLTGLFLWTAAAAFGQGHTNIQSVFMILMENVTWPEITSGTNAPYIRQVLLPMSSYGDQFFTAPKTSGSLPQYLWLEAGTNFGINDSADPSAHHIASSNHLAIQLQNAGLTWKAYQEDISGTNCPTGSGGLYAAFHNPFVYFDDVYLNSANCSNHIRPYAEFTHDLTENRQPHYSFITPNLCHDMHNSGGCETPNRIWNGDHWLSTEVPKILGSAAYRDHGAIFIIWDEGTGGAAGPFGVIVLSPWAKGGGYRDSNRYDHASTLRTVQEIFGLRPFLFAAEKAPGLSNWFKPPLRLAAPHLAIGSFGFTVTGISAGKTLLVQLSENLSDWRNVLTNASAPDPFEFLDPHAADLPHGFYRAVEEE